MHIYKKKTRNRENKIIRIKINITFCIYIINYECNTNNAICYLHSGDELG